MLGGAAVVRESLHRSPARWEERIKPDREIEEVEEKKEIQQTRG